MKEIIQPKFFIEKYDVVFNCNFPTLVIDLETTVKRDKKRGITDNSPHNPENKIVSIHYCVLKNNEEKVYKINEPKSIILNHKDVEKDHSYFTKVNKEIKEFQEVVSSCLVWCAHNSKFDLSYLRQTQNLPTMPVFLWDTMVVEYLLARGMRLPLSLSKTAVRRNAPSKKNDLVDTLFKKGDGLGFDEIPLDILIEYAEQDVLTTAHIYLEQRRLMEEQRNVGLQPLVYMCNEFAKTLQQIEGNGISIDLDRLEEVEKDYVKEKEELLIGLNEMSRFLMGDKPINLNSGSDISELIYSRKLVDKQYHKRIFNIGCDDKGKSLRPPKMSTKDFRYEIRSNFIVIKKQKAEHCSSCKGKGKIFRIKKNGEKYKRENICGECSGEGFIYTDTLETAGLKLSPDNPNDCSVHGFKSDRKTIEKLLSKIEIWEDSPKKDVAQRFLSSYIRLSSINTYLESFVKGIKYWTRSDSSLLHPNFNQCITRTGRLSSSNPNFQNQPKGRLFPVRKCVVSRWANRGGKILEADYSGLEFRIAGELSQDPQIKRDILEGRDVHKQTASIINQCKEGDVTKQMRQEAKKYTFAPLYGGQGAGEPPHIATYFQEYFKIYERLAVWHEELQTEAIKFGSVTTPSGREFFFPDTVRLSNGGSSNATNIKNYPVQSFATADIVPLAVHRMNSALDTMNSLVIITVHDSIVIDVYPGELDKVIELLVFSMTDLPEEFHARFNYFISMPLDIEIQVGDNWMEMEEIIIPEQYKYRLLCQKN